MKVVFRSLPDYLDELRRCAAIEPGISVVRGTISEMEVNAGVTKFTVTSGFHDGRAFYEATIDCGEDYAGGRNREQKAKDAATGTLEEIRKCCEVLKVEFRGGSWVMQ